MHHHESPDMHELMKCRSTAEKRAVIDTHMPSQQAIVCDDDIVSDDTIVTDVRAGHQPDARAPHAAADDHVLDLDVPRGGADAAHAAVLHVDAGHLGVCRHM